MPKKIQFEIEYVLKTSPKVVYKRLSTSSGLAEWFADNVTQKENVFTFEWEGQKQKAEQKEKEQYKYVRYDWLDDEDPDVFFMFRLEVDELTNGLALVITDYAEEDEIDESIELWDKQIEELKHQLGI